MIVKNAEATLAACLKSVSGIVDQIVIADTGSTDSTCAIARTFGATLLSVPWQDHFAYARNQAIAGATTDWILVLDADEELGPEAGSVLAGLLSAPGVGGYLVPIWEYVPFVSGSAWTATILPNDTGQQRAKAAPSYLVNTLCRLFLRREDIYFTGRVHEMVQPQIEAAGLRLEPAPFCIHHYGHLAEREAIARKRAFYNDLLQKRLADDATDVTTLTMCGLDEWEVHGRPLEALQYFRRALSVNPGALETWLLTAKVLCAVKHYEQALAALDVLEGVQKDAQLRYSLRGDALLGLGRQAEAREAYDHALSLNPGDRLLRAKQDYIDVDLGDAAAAIERLKLALAQVPSWVEVHELLVNACIRTGRIAEAAEEAERFSRLNRGEAFLVRAARLRAQLHEWDRAERLVRSCLAFYPGSAEAHELLMMALITRGELREAAKEAELLTSLANQPRSFLRAFGIYAQLHETEQARQWLERGLRCFPQSAEISQALAAFPGGQGVRPDAPAFPATEGSLTELRS